VPEVLALLARDLRGRGERGDLVPDLLEQRGELVQVQAVVRVRVVALEQLADLLDVRPRERDLVADTVDWRARASAARSARTQASTHS
jgi:hypothetical protein